MQMIEKRLITWKVEARTKNILANLSLKEILMLKDAAAMKDMDNTNIFKNVEAVLYNYACFVTIDRCCVHSINTISAGSAAATIQTQSDNLLWMVTTSRKKNKTFLFVKRITKSIVQKPQIVVRKMDVSCENQTTVMTCPQGITLILPIEEGLWHTALFALEIPTAEQYEVKACG